MEFDVLRGDVGQLPNGIEHARVGRAERSDDEERRETFSTVALDLFT